VRNTYLLAYGPLATPLTSELNWVAGPATTISTRNWQGFADRFDLGFREDSGNSIWNYSQLARVYLADYRLAQFVRRSIRRGDSICR